MIEISLLIRIGREWWQNIGYIGVQQQGLIIVFVGDR